MKNQKTKKPTARSSAKKKAPARSVRKSTAKRRTRPLHVHIALHPINLFALLCVGVLLSTCTFNALAASYTVRATVPAAPVIDGAYVTSPADGFQTSTQALAVSGTCPADTYVDLLDNGTLVGSATCSANAFSIGVDLQSGTNQLQVQDYNITNSPGPTTPSIMVTYTPPPPPPAPPTETPAPAPAPAPTATPQQLVVTQVDIGIPLQVNTVQVVSYQPTFSGVAPAYAKVHIVVHSNVFTCDTTADGQGYWSCTLPENLPVDVHHVDVTAKTPQGSTLTYPEFEVQVTGQSKPSQVVPAKFGITLASGYTYTVYNVGQNISYAIHITGGAVPYAFTVLWGDGSNETIIRQDASDFTISHKYGWINATMATRTVKVQGVDATGQASSLQFSVPVRNPGYLRAGVGSTKSGGLSGFFAMLRPWLWVLWPGYIIVLLLVIAFWLGERQERDKLEAEERRKQRALGGNRNRHAHMHR